MSPRVCVRGVTVRFGGLIAVNDVGFEAAAGEIIGLIGPNGAGKTTLFSTLVGLVRPAAGSISLDGARIEGRKPHVIARAGMTKTFQNTALFPGMSLLDNVMTAAVVREDLKSARRTAEACLERVGLRKAALANVADLTFPQKALAELARALAVKPRVLLLDEVMAALTPAEMDEVMATMRSLRDEDGMTLLVVEHHMRAIMRLCERILVLNFGRLIADGPPSCVSADPDVIRAYLGQDHAHHA
ncbi:ABC transporter ATP-binding protein [Xanthobacter sp. KR7-225]|uniref:ABC transporter ATP-binding protein n=1 Tax=Xanthobacter sp. KR7-225 TaxID=3156613 RepID=UPI0032B5B4A3